MKFDNGKLWKVICDGTIEIRTLTECYLASALDVLDKSFFFNESVCIACEINLADNTLAREELRELCRQTALEGISIVAIDILNKKPIAVAFNKIQSNEDPFFVRFRNNYVKSPNAKCLMDYMISMDSQINVFEMYKIDCICEVMFLATLPEFEQKGIGLALVRFSIELARNWKQGLDLEYIEPSLRMKRPKAVTALLTSSYSQKIGRKLGFEILNTVPYSHFSFNGKTFDQRIGDLHKFSEQVTLRL